MASSPCGMQPVVSARRLYLYWIGSGPSRSALGSRKFVCSVVDVSVEFSLGKCIGPHLLINI